MWGSVCWELGEEPDVHSGALHLCSTWDLAGDAQHHQSWVSCSVRGKVPLVCLESQPMEYFKGVRGVLTRWEGKMKSTAVSFCCHMLNACLFVC